MYFRQAAFHLQPNFIGPAFDVEWKTFAAKLAQQQDTTVIPFFFHGRNSVLYQMARRMSVTLGYSLMFREICKQMNSEVHVTMRAPIQSDALSALTTRQEIIEFLRNRTYGEK